MSIEIVRVLQYVLDFFADIVYHKEKTQGRAAMLSIHSSPHDMPGRKKLVEEIYRKYKQLMFSVSYSVLHNTEDAEDAVHEAFVRIIKNISRIDGASQHQTRAFVVIIVKNISLDMLRRRSKAKETPLDELDSWADEPSCEDEAIASVSVEILKEALGRLPDNYYEILLLEAYYKCSTEELASLLGIGHENARSRLRRARLKLKSILKEMDYEQP